MKAALYARVSTRDQSIVMQTNELGEYCARRGWEVAAGYCEIGVSGSRESRPKLNLLLAAARRREFDAVVVYRLDRLARSLKQLISVLEEFRALGIEFVSLHEQIDTSTPAGRLQFSILGAFAEFERGIIRERVRSGLQAAKAKGKQLGRPRILLDRLKIVEMRRQGRSWREIEALTKIPTRTLIRASEAWQKSPSAVLPRVAKTQEESPPS